MSNHGKPRNRHTLLKLIVLMLLAVVIGFGAWLGVSFKQTTDLLTQADGAYKQMEQCVEKEDYKTALTYARSAATYTSQASEELKGTQWDIAQKIPVLGTEVDTMRSIGSISGTLADDAVLPTLDSLEELMSDGLIADGKVDISKIGEKVDQVVQFASTLQDANKVVDECSAQVDALPTSRVSFVNEWAGSMKGTIASLDELLDKYVSLADMVVGLSDTWNTLLGSLGTSQVESTPQA